MKTSPRTKTNFGGSGTVDSRSVFVSAINLKQFPGDGSRIPFSRNSLPTCRDLGGTDTGGFDSVWCPNPMNLLTSVLFVTSIFKCTFDGVGQRTYRRRVNRRTFIFLGS